MTGENKNKKYKKITNHGYKMRAIYTHVNIKTKKHRSSEQRMGWGGVVGERGFTQDFILLLCSFTPHLNIDVFIVSHISHHPGSEPIQKPRVHAGSQSQMSIYLAAFVNQINIMDSDVFPLKTRQKRMIGKKSIRFPCGDIQSPLWR